MTRMLVSAIEWKRYVIWNGSRVMMHDTIFQFRDHLNHYLMTGRTLEWEIGNMSAVDFNAIYNQFKSKKGTFGVNEIKATVEWFKTELTTRAEELEAEAKAKAEREANRDKALHAAFDKAGVDKLPKPVVLDFALDYLKVPHFPIGERSQERENLLKILESSEEWGTYVSGPNSGLVRCKHKGEETAFYKANKKDIQFGKVTRQRNKDKGMNGATNGTSVVGGKTYERFTETVKGFGFTSKAQLQQALSDLGVSAATEAQLKGWLNTKADEEAEVE